jgi:hypothetical protein
VSKARASDPPAESPAITIFSGLIALCAASGGGSIRYRSVRGRVNFSHVINQDTGGLTGGEGILQCTWERVLWGHPVVD